ncbi:glycosyltransferase family 1 protein [Rhodovibrio salinarum]|uniref:Glycosyltransferase family 1 protein n=2 Tax=Rhodovibrio salinarum TaxID=1087 RepID=A0A934QH22_9PROT|nr:glycosyltransferase family 1 protein [Rhodovibrio salinarum]
MGRFNQFDLARQMHRHGMLETLITSYPRWKLRDEGIPEDRIASFPWVTLLRSAATRVGITEGRVKRELTWWAQQAIDWYASRIVGDCDILIGQSGQGLRAGKTVQARGGKYVCHRGSCHIRTQRTLLRTEYEKWGVPVPKTDTRVLDKEEQEYAQADLITVPSEFARQTYIDQGIAAEKVKKIPYGVDLTRFRKTGDPDPQQFNVLYVGQICLRKGIPYLLDAFQRIQVANKHLTLVGRLAPELRDMVHAAQASGQITVTGHVQLRDIPRLMSQSHVLVLPSIEDGFAKVQSEALACGTPVIGSTHSGASDLFTDGCEGFVVRPGDSDVLAERLQRLADSPDLRQRMSQAAQARVASIGGWNDYGDQARQVFEELRHGSDASRPGS